MRSPTLLAALTVSLLAPSAAFGADVGFQVNVEGAASHLVGEYKSNQFGWGATGALSPELRIGKHFALELPLGVIGLTQASHQDPAYMPSENGTAYFAMPGIKLRPLAARWGDPLWIAGGGGVTETGGTVRPSADVRAGVDFHVGRFDIGPFAGLIQIIDTSSGVRSQDARVFVFGIHAAASPFPRDIIAPQPPKDEVVVRRPDPDRDGEPEAFDSCPNGSELDGCPDPMVWVQGDRIMLDDRVLFPVDQSKILVSSYPLLHGVSKLLKDHPEYEKVVITGHADDTGDDDYNMKLSAARARSVRAFVVGTGVDADRLGIQFFGKRRPRVSGTNYEARKQNRRVEFEITSGAS
jgi:outer membrane protein OmpA-like peptidoglycan-associated protein